METHNCPNCGAPITDYKCPYCGTIMYDFANVDTEEPCYLRIRCGNRLTIVKAWTRTVNFTYKIDEIPTIDIVFDVVSDSDGVMARIIDRDRRDIEEPSNAWVKKMCEPWKG